MELIESTPRILFEHKPLGRPHFEITTHLSYEWGDHAERRISVVDPKNNHDDVGYGTGYGNSVRLDDRAFNKPFCERNFIKYLTSLERDTCDIEVNSFEDARNLVHACHRQAKAMYDDLVALFGTYGQTTGEEIAADHHPIGQAQQTPGYQRLPYSSLDTCGPIFGNGR